MRGPTTCAAPPADAAGPCPGPRRRRSPDRTRLGREDAPVDELVSKLAGRLVVDDRQRAQVLGADREDLAVVVAALALDRGGVAGERPHLVGGELLQALQVDDDLGGGLGPRRDAALGEQLGHRHAVEVGELGQLLDGDRTVTTLVGAHHDRLPAAARLLLDPVQRQALLLSDGAQLSAERLGIVAHVATSFFGGAGRGTDVGSTGANATGARECAGLWCSEVVPPADRGHPERTRSIRRVIFDGAALRVKPCGPSRRTNRQSPLERLIDTALPTVARGVLRVSSSARRAQYATAPTPPAPPAISGPRAARGRWYRRGAAAPTAATDEMATPDDNRVL